jgi:myo-inositol-1(or 4)-monophosphatase
VPDPLPAPDPLLLSTAIEVVLHAGEMQMASLGRRVRIDKKGEIDLVTEVDLAIESWFRELISARFPSHAVLAEEFDAPASAGRAGSDASAVRTDPARPRWIFDPIDGTTNYAHGLPIFCASLAVEVDGELTAGAVYDPTRRELFTAERGRGAYLNGERLRVSEADTLLDSLLCTGFPYDVHTSADEVVGLFGAFVTRARAVRRLGSAALDLCYVASGRLDGFWEQRLKPWDSAAGALIVREAGGHVTGMDGAAFSPMLGQVVASNGRIQDALLDVIRAFRSERSRNRTP